MESRPSSTRSTDLEICPEVFHEWALSTEALLFQEDAWTVFYMTRKGAFVALKVKARLSSVKM